MGLTLLLVIGALSFAFFYLRRKMNYWKDRGIPCLTPSYIFGNLDGVGQKIHFTTNLQNIYENFKNGNKLCGFFFLQSPRIMVMDLELIKNILIKDFNNFIDRGVFHTDEDPLSNHLFAIEGEKWRSLRHKLSATFTSGKMRMMYPIIESFSSDLVNLIESLSSNKDGIDVKNVCTRFTADVIGSCGFGLECNAMRDENTEMMRMGKFFDITDTKIRLNFFFVNIFQSFAKKLNMKITPQFITDFFLPMIKETFEYREKNDVNRNDFLSLLMQIKKYGKLKDEEMENVGTLTFNELAAQAFIFFVAGFETSSTTMTMALYELAYRYDIQEKLRIEIEEVVSRHDGIISYDAISEMTYLDQVINETLRLYSPIGQLFRICAADYKVDGMNFTIDKGMPIIIPVHAIHHDSRYYYDPELFNPDRFSSEEVKKRPHYSFLPFGTGPRNCIGERFGIMQSKLAIATIIKNFRLSLHEETRYPLLMDCKNIVVTAFQPIMMNAERLM
ncbi:hypothetical protein ACKWTF_013886 [Chironomus riparius]